MFDYEVKITPFVNGHYLEINIEGKPAYKSEFPHYGAAASYAERFLMEEYRKRGTKNVCSN